MSTHDQELLETIHALMKGERWAEVIAAAPPGLAESSQDHDLLWNVGWAYFQLEQYDQAVSYLRKANDGGPVKPNFYGALGMAYYELKNYIMAELWLLRAVAVRESSLTRLALALVYLKQGLVEVAEAVHKEGIRLKPNSRERVEGYADFLCDVGRDEEAKKLYEDAAGLSSDES
jgi:tetratricopeptide (TPR) repeat protein